MLGLTPRLHSIAWLSGVRRVGKTTLARMFPDAVYMNCDLPSVQRAVDDPELFLEGQVGRYWCSMRCTICKTPAGC